MTQILSHNISKRTLTVILEEHLTGIHIERLKYGHDMVIFIILESETPEYNIREKTRN